MGMTSIVGKVNRSGFYHSIATTEPVNNAREAKCDEWGCVVVAVLLVCLVDLMRLVLVY
jgi:hypothetical protein